MLAATPVLAQDGDAETNTGADDAIIVTGALSDFGATKSDTPIVEVARSISIETAEDFEDKGFQTLDDALTYMAGVTAEPFGFSTRGDFSQVRGLDAPEYRDNLQFLFGFYNNPRPDLYTLEQVEVLKGPASVLYGAASPGGIINVVTKRPFNETAGEIRAEYGSFDRKQIAGDFNLAVPGAEDEVMFRFVGLYRDAGTQIDEVEDDKLVIAPAVTLRPSTGTEITLLANYTDQDTDTAHQFYPVTGTFLPSQDGREIDTTEYFGAPGFNAYDSESLAITLLASQQLTAAWSLEGVARYVDSSADYRQAWPAFLGNGVPRVDANGDAAWTFYLSDRMSEQYAFDVRLRGEFMTGPIEHEVLAGVQYQDVTTDADNAYIFALGTINVFDPQYQNVPSVADVRAQQTDGPENYVEELGFYVSNQMTLGDLVGTVGVRFDQVDNAVENGVSQEDDATSFSAGLLWRGPGGISPYVSYAESFEPVVGIDTETGEQLLPQEGRQWEAGIKWQPSGMNALLTLAAFDIEQSNLPNPNALAGGNSQQEGVAKIKGLEFEANAVLGGLRLDGNVSYLDTEDPNGWQLSAIPEWQASLFALYRVNSGPLAGLSFGGGIRHVGESESSGVSALTGDVLTYRTDSYTVGDLSAAYETGPWELRVNARNVTGEDYFTVCLVRGDCYPGESGSVTGTLAYNF
ncbi:TonB-dependent siderophore receptor [Aurantiacibacter poecillastricola]|uniref:TonB-dependent siderophore receptor n=1 Tax=Aurantiacibacter poecillastricola TaxID=3064385 RepID=UPI00273FECDE|nr:TonB-dependent siderophore receptor [Aurantiacibacter sp. 219JJ12-13]MDP5261552.1 TonB-dependent siderophore receptor [Aurantiacibacter sp. 219JJ12-13]